MLTITDLPRIMQDKEHWPVAAACLRRWFQNGASQLSEAGRKVSSTWTPCLAVN